MSGGPAPVLGPTRDKAAVFKRMVDPDTFDLTIDLDFEVQLVSRVRLYAVDAWETSGPNRAAGKAASAFVAEWFAKSPNILIRSYKAKAKEKYGRWLVEIWRGDGVGKTLNAELLDRGFGVAMDDRGRVVTAPKPRTT